MSAKQIVLAFFGAMPQQRGTRLANGTWAYEMWLSSMFGAFSVSATGTTRHEAQNACIVKWNAHVEESTASSPAPRQGAPLPAASHGFVKPCPTCFGQADADQPCPNCRGEIWIPAGSTSVDSDGPTPPAEATRSPAVAASQAGQDAVGLPAGAQDLNPVPDFAPPFVTVKHFPHIGSGNVWEGKIEAHTRLESVRLIAKAFSEQGAHEAVIALHNRLFGGGAVNSHGALVAENEALRAQNAAMREALDLIRREVPPAKGYAEDCGLSGAYPFESAVHIKLDMIDGYARDGLSVGAESPAGSPSVSRPSAEREGGADGDADA